MAEDQERTERLVQLRNGMWIDPRVINCITAYAIARPVGNHKAAVSIETRGGEVHRIPCVDIKGAEKLRDSLAQIANFRGKQVRTKRATDWKGTPMPGDPAYADFVDSFFAKPPNGA